jgi:hypothetical protein
MLGAVLKKFETGGKNGRPFTLSSDLQLRLSEYMIDM